MSYEMFVASNGVDVPVDSLDQTFVYNGDNIDYIQVVYRGITYRQTYTYSGSTITAISDWTPV